MPELPEIERARWLFADNVVNGNLFEFVEFKPNHKSKKGSEIPVFVIVGTDKEHTGEFLLSLWNIANYEELKKQLGENTDNWKIPTRFTTHQKGKQIELRLENENN